MRTPHTLNAKAKEIKINKPLLMHSIKNIYNEILGNNIKSKKLSTFGNRT